MDRNARRAALAACFGAALLSGCGKSADSFKPVSIEVDRPIVYPESKGSKTAIGLMRIRNKGGTADRLLRASSDKSGPVQLKRTYMVEGDPVARTVQSIDVPAGSSVEMKTSGYYLVFDRVGEELKDKGTFPVVLEFMVAGKVPLSVSSQTTGPALPKPAPKDADGDPAATGGPISIQGLETGTYGTEATSPAPKAGSGSSSSSSSSSTSPSSPSSSGSGSTPSSGTGSSSSSGSSGTPSGNLSKPSSSSS